MKHKLWAGLLTALIALPALASTDEKVVNNAVYAIPDAQDWTEGAYALPPYPVAPQWVGFFVPLKSGYTFFVDGATLNLSQDGVLHYVLRTLSASGAESLSLQGLQCAQRSVRSYAFGDSINKQWIASTRALWKRLNSDNPVNLRLANDVCPDWETPKTVADVLSSVKKSPWY